MESMFEEITAKIVEAIEAGAGTYRMPWHRTGIGTPVNAVTGRPYRGINTLLLWAGASRAGFSSGRWATYRQWLRQGGQVRRGERSTLVLLWKPVGRAGGDDEEENQPRSGVIARAFRVFNADQVDGAAVAASPVLVAAPIAHAQRFFSGIDAAIWQGSDDAFYDPASDTISVPSLQAFVSADAYYSVLAHELTHWTGAPHRLFRELAGRFGSEAYAMEELIAELGAAFVTAHLGLACEPRRDHAPYIASWLRVLGNDPRAIVTAASRAQAAADFLIARGGGEQPPMPDASFEPTVAGAGA